MEQTFTPNLRQKADEIVARYETKRAAVLEILHLLQDHYGFINQERELAVAEYLELPPVDVHEVLTFYTLFYRKPKAKIRLKVCRTLACSLLGAQEIISDLEKRFGLQAGQMVPKGNVAFETVECLGACEMAPMLQLNDDQYIGQLTREKIDQIIDGKTDF